MTRARKSLIDLSATPYYHLIARCVRRAFLCGNDKYSGKNFDHRRKWLVKRMKLLSDVFAIDIAAYAIMSNHYHIVVKVNKNKALDWSVEEVIGKYWEGRYKSQALLDDKAILSCMAYVDLNPIRAKVATELKNSDFTSIQERIHNYKNTAENSKQSIQKTELFEHKSQPMQ